MNKRFHASLSIEANAIALRFFWHKVWRYRALLQEMTRRELVDRYAGQWFGCAWVIAHPLLMILVFLFLFAIVFNVRLPSGLDLPQDYATYLLSGLIPWLSMQAALAGASTALTSSPNLVKQAMFPIEILPLRHVLASMVPLGVGLLVLVVHQATSAEAAVQSAALLLPVAVALHLAFITGICLMLAVVGAFMRDVKDFVQLYLQVGTYLIPIVYLPGWLPEVLRPVILLNPFGHVVILYQDLLFYGGIFHWAQWAAAAVMAAILLVVGTRLFVKLQPHVADVV